MHPVTEEPPRRRVSRATLIRVAAAIVALGGLAAAFASQMSTLTSTEWQVSPPWLIAGVLAFVALQFWMCLLWLGIVRRLGADLPTPRGRSIWCVSVLGRYVPTGALMIAGRIDMARRAGVSRRVCMASIVYELAFTLAGALVVSSAFVAALVPAPLGWIAPVIAVATLAALHPRVLRPVADRLLARAGKEPLPAVLSGREVVGYAVAYCACFVLAGLATFALVLGLHPVAAADAPLVVGSFAVGFVASVVGFLAPGGLGAREVAQATALTAALPFALGLAVAAAVRVAQMAVEVGFAGAMPALERYSGRPVTPAVRE